MTRRYATELLKLYGRFTEEEFRQIGPLKLRLALAAPEEQQAEVLDKLKGGAPKREIERDLGRKGKDTPDGRKRENKAAPSAAERKTITIAQIEGRKTVPLFQKPAKKGETGLHLPAKKLIELPWGFLDLTNDVRMWFSILQAPDGALKLRIDVKRQDEAK